MKKKILAVVISMMMLCAAIAPAVSATESVTAFPKLFTVTNNFSGLNENTYVYNDFGSAGYVDRIATVHNPDGKSVEFSLSDSASWYPFMSACGNFGLAVNSAASKTAGAIVAVVSADSSNPKAFPHKLSANSLPVDESGTYTLVSINAAGEVNVNNTCTYSGYVWMNPGTVNYFILPLKAGTDLSAVSNAYENRLQFHSDVAKNDYIGCNYYFDSIGVADDAAALIADIMELAENQPLKVTASSTATIAQISWTVSDLYNPASYLVNLYDASGKFQQSKVTSDNAVSFPVTAGGSYQTRVYAYNADGALIAVSDPAVVTSKLFDITNNVDNAGNLVYSNFNTTGIVDTDVTIHNPDGKSLDFACTSGWPIFSFTGNLANNADIAKAAGSIVVVISADMGNPDTYPMGLSANGLPVKETYTQLNITADGKITTSVHGYGNGQWTYNEAGSVSYYILPLADGVDLSACGNSYENRIQFYSTADASNYPDCKYYLDTVGVTVNGDDLIQGIKDYYTVSSNKTVLYKETNSFSGENGNYAYYCDYAPQGYVDTEVSVGNQDGKSFEFGCSETSANWAYMQTNGNFGADSANAKATVVVVSADSENTVSYPLGFNWNTIRVEGSKTTMVTVTSDGTVTAAEFPAGGYTSFKPGTTNYLITELAAGTDLTAAGPLNFNGGYNTREYQGCNYYLDSIGYTENPESLIQNLKDYYDGKKIAAVDIPNDTTELFAGQSASIKASLYTDTATELTYYSSNPQVVAVDSKTGIISAMDAGTAEISAVVLPGNQSDVCTVTVKNVKTGDVNTDGAIDVIDLIRLKKYFADENNTEIHKTAADCDSDGIVTVSDMAACRKYLLGIAFPTLSSLKTSDIGFGYFGARLNINSVYDDVEKMAQSDYVNTFMDGGEYALGKMGENNAKGWINVYNIYSMVSNGQDGWQAKFDSLVSEFSTSGNLDTVLGWYLDEPTDHQAVKAVSEYAQKYGKRFFVCYMAASVCPDNATLNSAAYDTVGISEDTTQYLTDIAYDLYWDATEYASLYSQVNTSMRTLLGNNTPKIWYVPYVAVWGSVLTSTPAEQNAACEKQIAHLEMMYNFLKAEQNPGGLMCYAYNINPNDINQYGLKQANIATDGAFNPLLTRTVEIGREICTGKMSSQAQ